MNSPFYDASALLPAERHGLFIKADRIPTQTPFVEARRYALFKTVELAGRQYADYRSILHPGDLDTLLSAHETRYADRIIELGGIAESDPSGLWIEDWAGKNHLPFRREPMPRAPYLEIDGSWEQYKAKKRSKFWYNIARAERLLEEKGGVLSFRILDTPEKIGEMFEPCLGLYRRNWSRWTSSSVFLSPEGGAFLREMLERLSAEGKAELAVLEQAGTLLAFSAGLKSGPGYYFYLFAVNRDGRFAAHSPGKLHLRNLLESAFGRKFGFFDFMAGEEPYKYEWTKTSRGRSVYYVARKGLSGRLRLNLYVAAVRAVASLKKNRFLRKCSAVLAGKTS